MEKYIIYRYWSPKNKSYIGQTCQPLFIRSGQKGNGYKSSPKFFHAIQKYGFDWFKEHYEILESDLEKTEADRLEKFYIEKFDSIKNGYNIQTGGTFNPADFCVRPVVGINCETKEVEYFESIASAAREKGVKGGVIGKVVRHEKNHYTFAGYSWFYLEEWEGFSKEEQEEKKNIKPQVRNQKRQVICVTTNKVYPSLKDAKKDTGINNISACCRHKIKSAGNIDGQKLVWKYYDEFIAEEGIPCQEKL